MGIKFSSYDARQGGNHLVETSKIFVMQVVFEGLEAFHLEQVRHLPCFQAAWHIINVREKH